MLSITGKIAGIIACTQENSFTLAVFKPYNDKEIRISGKGLNEYKGVTVELTGEYANDPDYGDVFKCETCIPVLLDNSRDSVIDFLSSPLIDGVGRKTAENIYDTFGIETLNIIENDPKQLVKIKGILSKRAYSISESYKRVKKTQEELSLLKTTGLSLYQIGILNKLHGSNLASKIKDNPYRLMKDLGLSFKKADDIALKIGISHDSSLRLDKAIEASQEELHANGDIGVDINTLIKRTLKNIKNSVDDKALQGRIDQLIKKHTFKVVTKVSSEEVKNYLFPRTLWEEESYLAKRIVDLGCEENKIATHEELFTCIDTIERKKSISLDQTQKEAVFKGLNNSLTVITGGPGTGKSTIMQFIADIYEQITKKPVYLLAPTGRAARKLAEYTGRPATTIHAALKLYDPKFRITKKTKPVRFNNCLLIIDEFSMADVTITSKLFKAIKKNVKIVISGDSDQLPSVGPGAVLDDIISSNAVETIKLTKTFRQAADSTIINNVIKVRDGELKLKTDNTFCAYLSKSSDEIFTRLENLYVERIKEYGKDNVMLLLPYRQGSLGTRELNNRLQARINPPQKGKNETTYEGTIYREGDLVMQVNRNIPDASNGDIGVITAINFTPKTTQVEVKINEKLITYDYSDLYMLDLAYAYTIHKSQGSEAKAVITCVTSDYPVMLFRSIPYVAFSRGREHVDVVYDSGLTTAIKTIKKQKRITMLKEFLEREKGEFVPINYF